MRGVGHNTCVSSFQGISRTWMDGCRLRTVDRKRAAMERVRMCLSIPRPLFEQAKDLACKMKVSRSRLFVLALEDYLHRQQNRDLLAQINAAYAGELDPAERTLCHKSRRQHRQVVEGER
jgi:antitoxin MazE6